MKIQDVEIRAHALLKRHRLDDWNFKFDRSVRRFGMCTHSIRTIQLSKKLCELNEYKEVKDVILHEIAHALAGPRNGHNRVWRSKCIRIGARPERCYSTSNVVQPATKHEYQCIICKHKWNTVRKLHRLNQRFHKGCGGTLIKSR